MLPPLRGDKKKHTQILMEVKLKQRPLFTVVS